MEGFLSPQNSPSQFEGGFLGEKENLLRQKPDTLKERL